MLPFLLLLLRQCLDCVFHFFEPLCHLLDLTLFVGLGGVTTALVMRRMAKQACIPEKDPRLIGSLEFENA